MKVSKIADAMSYIDDDLISNAIEYNPIKRKRFFRNKLTAVAACFTLIAIIMGVYPLFNQQNTLTKSSLVFTAYAMENGSVKKNIMESGTTVPVSVFHTSTGLKCFVFSRNKTDTNETTSVSILMGGELDVDLGEILDFTTDASQNYYVGIIGETEYDMYSFPAFIHDIEHEAVNQYSIVVMKNENGYVANFIEVTKYNYNNAH